jgi:hypothetical protein
MQVLKIRLRRRKVLNPLELIYRNWKSQFDM